MLPQFIVRIKGCFVSQLSKVTDICNLKVLFINLFPVNWQNSMLYRPTHRLSLSVSCLMNEEEVEVVLCFLSFGVWVGWVHGSSVVRLLEIFELYVNMRDY